MILWQRVRCFGWIFPTICFSTPAQHNMELNFTYNYIISSEKNINLLFMFFYFSIHFRSSKIQQLPLIPFTIELIGVENESDFRIEPKKLTDINKTPQPQIQNTHSKYEESTNISNKCAMCTSGRSGSIASRNRPKCAACTNSIRRK